MTFVEDTLGSISDVLRDIRENTAGAGQGQTFTPARNAIVIGNERWEDEEITELTYSDLAPGDFGTVVVAESFDREVRLALRAIGTTVHPHDFDNDNEDENAVRYHIEKKESVGDGWNALPGMTTTAPQGDITEPVEVLPGSYIGPVQAWRVRYENRTEGTANPTTVDKDALGCTLRFKVIRTDDGGV